MRIFVSALVGATLVAGMATQAAAQSNGRDRNGASGYRADRPCVVTGWTDWSLTRPIFKCPEDNGPANRRRR